MLTGAVLLVGMVAALIAWRLVSGPTDINFLKPDVEAAISDARGGRKVEIANLTLQWLQEDTEFKLVADKIRFLDDKGETVGGADEAQIDLNAVALLGGRFELSELVLSGGTLSIKRSAAGEIRIADHVIPPLDPSLLPENPTPVQILEFSINNIVSNVRESQTVKQLDKISLQEFSVSFIDEALKIDWTIENVALDVVHADDEISVQANGDPIGEGAPQTAKFTTDLNLQTGAFELAATLLQLPVAEFPALKYFQPSLTGELKADILLQAAFDGENVQRLSASLETKSGEVRYGDRVIRLGRNDLTVLYDVAGDAFEIDGRELDANFLKGAVLIRFPEAEGWLTGPLTMSHAVEVISPRLSLDFRPMFPSLWSFDSARVEGEVDLKNLLFRFDKAAVKVDNATANASGEIYLADKQAPKDLPFGLRLTASTNSIVKPEQVLLFWPVKLGHSARKWVVENVKFGELSEAEFRMDLKPDSLRDDVFDNEELQLEFSFKNAEVGFLSDLPPVKKGVGRGRLEGNRFSLDVESGEFSNWQISSGLVQIPRFKPDGETLVVRATGSGNVRDIVKTLSNSRLQLEKQYGLNIDAISGTGTANFELKRPIQKNVPDDATRFSVEGKVRDGGFKGLYGDLNLTKGNAVVKVDNDHIRLNGYGELLNTPVQFDWIDKFNDDGPERTTLKASGNVTPDLLNRYGVASRAYLTGDVFTRLDAKGVSITKLDRIDLDFDLTPNRLNFSELDWIKPTGQPAQAALKIRGGKGSQNTTLRMSAEGFNFEGALKTSDTGMIEGVRVNRLFLDDQVNIRGELLRTANGGLVIDVNGPFLNISPYLDGLMSSGEGTIPVFGDVKFLSRIDRLRLKDGLELTAVDLAADFQGPILQSFSLKGKSVQGGAIDFQLQEDAETKQRALTATVADAGGLLQGLLGTDFVTGGTLTATGTLSQSAEDKTKLLVRIKNARIKKAPLLTQVLSLASLRGLADVMNGDGILFTDVRLPLEIDAEGYYLDGAKASGPAMGFTTKGHILNDGQKIALDGVLVPSFGVNSALGGIPIIGDLFVSRDGEGVFAITYGVRGSLEEAKVSVNPLAGLLPGVLRRIFENPAAEPIPKENTPPEQLAPAD